MPCRRYTGVGRSLFGSPTHPESVIHRRRLKMGIDIAKGMAPGCDQLLGGTFIGVYARAVRVGGAGSVRPQRESGVNTAVLF